LVPNVNDNDRVYYEPLYFDQVGALGTVLAGQGTGVMPIWKGITITSNDATVAITGDPAELIWDLSVPCCAEITGIKTRMDDMDTRMDGVDTSIADLTKSIEDMQAELDKCDCDALNVRILFLESALALGGKPMIQKNDEAVAVKDQVQFELSNIPAKNSTVKMYINGVRISNSAYIYTTTDNKVTYIPEANGSHGLLDGERIQFDYSYSVE